MNLTRKAFDEVLRSEDCTLNTIARMVLMAYASHMSYTDKVQEAWPGKATVAAYAGINRDTASRYIAALVKDGWLVKSGVRHRQDRYNYVDGFYIAQGTVSKRLIARREAWNKGNVSERLRQEQGSDADRSSTATPTEAVSDSDSVSKNNHTTSTFNNHLNNQAQDKPQQPYSWNPFINPVQDVAALLNPLQDEGLFKVVTIVGSDSDSVGIAQSEGEAQAVSEYEAMAKARGFLFHSDYLAAVKVPWISDRKAFHDTESKHGLTVDAEGDLVW